MSLKKRIGILGGTFNPIHYSHLILAVNAYDQFKLDEVLIIPAGQPPHKQHEDIIAEEHRVNMIKLAIEDQPYIRLSSIELNRETLSYTSDTLKELVKENPYTEYYFIMGADSMFQIETWNEPDTIMKLANILVATRYSLSDEVLDNQIRYLIQKYSAKIYRLPIPNIDLSSRMIRERIQKGHTIKFFVPKKVEEYIYANHLYV